MSADHSEELVKEFSSKMIPGAGSWGGCDSVRTGEGSKVKHIVTLRGNGSRPGHGHGTGATFGHPRATRRRCPRIGPATARMVHLEDHTLYRHWTYGLVVGSIDPPVILHDEWGRSSIGVCPGCRPKSASPMHFLRRKWHQLERKCKRRMDFHRMLRSSRRQAGPSRT